MFFKKNFPFPSFEEFYTFSKNFVTLALMTRDVLPFSSRPCKVRMAIQWHFCVGSATLSSLLILKRHDDHTADQWWQSVRNLDQWPSFNVSSGHIRPHAFFVHDFLQKHDRAMQMVSLCSARQDESSDMHIDLRHFLTLKPLNLRPLEVVVDLGLSGSTSTCFYRLARMYY